MRGAWGGLGTSGQCAGKQREGRRDWRDRGGETKGTAETRGGNRGEQQEEQGRGETEEREESRRRRKEKKLDFNRRLTWLARVGDAMGLEEGSGGSKRKTANCGTPPQGSGRHCFKGNHQDRRFQRKNLQFWSDTGPDAVCAKETHKFEDFKGKSSEFLS